MMVTQQWPDSPGISEPDVSTPGHAPRLLRPEEYTKAEIKPDAEVEPTITVGDKSYLISSLPNEIRDLISYYTRWDAEKVEAMSEANKCDAACRAISQEIAQRIQALEKVVAGLKQPT